MCNTRALVCCCRNASLLFQGVAMNSLEDASAAALESQDLRLFFGKRFHLCVCVLSVIEYLDTVSLCQYNSQIWFQPHVTVLPRILTFQSDIFKKKSPKLPRHTPLILQMLALMELFCAVC